MAVMQAWFGEPEVKGGGRLYYRQRVQYGEGGPEVMWDNAGVEDKGAFAVLLTGRHLTVLGLMDQLRLLSALMAAGVGRCSRIDLAVDLKGQGGDKLIDDLEAAAKRGELMSQVEHNRLTPMYRGKRVIGDTLTLGSRRGARYGRWYDKGLEQDKFSERGVWIRAEVEVKGKASWRLGEPNLASHYFWALVAAYRFVAGESGELPPMLRDSIMSSLAGGELTIEGLVVGLVLGAFEFREPRLHLVNRARSRRPESSWWVALKRFLGSVVVRVSVRRYPDWARTRKWLESAVMPMVRSVVDAMKGDVAGALDYLGFSDARPAKSQAVHQLQVLIASG